MISLIARRIRPGASPRRSRGKPPLFGPGLSLVLAITLGGTAVASTAERLTPYSRTVNHGNGHSTTEISLAPVHYYTPGGGLAKINTTITGVKASPAGPGFTLGNETNLLKSWFNSSRPEVHAEGGGASLTFAPTMLRFTGGGSSQEIARSKDAVAKASGNKVTYANAFDGVDAVYAVGAGTVSKRYVFAAAPQGASGTPEFVEIGERLSLGAGTSMAEVGGSWTITGTDPRNSLQVVGVMASDARWQGHPTESFHGKAVADALTQGSLSVETMADGSKVIWTRIPYAWFMAAGRQYPVTVDPTFTLQPSGAAGKDSSLWQASQTSNWGSYGWMYLDPGSWTTGAPMSEAIEFDLTPAGIPTGSTINSAVLGIFRSGSGQGGGSGDQLEAREFDASWVEATITWANAPPTGFLAGTGQTNGANTFATIDVTPSVQRFVDNTHVNFGWRLNGLTQADEFHASDITNYGYPSTNCPKLTLDWTEPQQNETNCSDGIDDDGDTLVDCDDSDCAGDPNCQGGGGSPEIEAKLDDETRFTDDTEFGTKLDTVTTKLDAIEAKLDAGAGGDVGTKLDAIEAKLDQLPSKLDTITTKLDAIEAKLDAGLGGDVGTKLDAIEAKLDQLPSKLDAIEAKLDAGLGGDIGTKLDAIESKLDDETRFTDDTELSLIEAKLDDETRFTDDSELSVVIGEVANVEAKLDDETRFTDDTELAAVEAKLDDETRFTDDTELAAIEAKLDVKDEEIDAIEGKLDDETRFTDDTELAAIEAKLDASATSYSCGDSITLMPETLRVQIEEDLLNIDRIVHWVLPEALGGRLECVSAVVLDTINQAALADIRNANPSDQALQAWQEGEDFRLSPTPDYKRAYDAYRKAYRLISQGR